jgi:hypothetical protein
MSAEIVSAVASCVSALVGVLLLRQISLTRDQIRIAREQSEATATWNRLSGAYALISPMHLAESERRVHEALAKLSIPYVTPTASPLNESQTEQVWQNENVYVVVREHLNLLEEYATAIRCGSIDKDLAYALRCYAITRATKHLRLFIERARRHFDDHTIYLEMDNLLKDWEPLRLAERQAIQDQLRRALADHSVKTSYSASGR